MSDVIEVNKTSINTRRFVERLVERAIQNNRSAIDLSNVEFVSRSVADEIVHRMERETIDFVGLNGDVAEMVGRIEDQKEPTPA